MKFTLLCLLALPLSLVAATLRVNNAPNTSPDHATIQAAINAASDGDTILIEGSTTPYAAFTLANKRLNLIGPGYGLPLNLGTPANKLTAMIGSPASYVRTSTASAGSADGSLVMGLEFSYELVLDGCSNVTVSRCLFNGSGSGRLNVNGAGNLVSQCFLRGSSSSVLTIGFNGSNSRVENCIMPELTFYVGSSGVSIVYLRNNLLFGLGGGPTVIQADNNIFLGTSVSTANCIFRNNLFPGSPSGLVGSGNLTGVNLATVMPNHQNASASFDGRYKLSPLDNTNPAYNAGVDGTHIGPFGGPNPYILSGIPPLPTIDELSVPSFASPGGNVTIRVKVSARP